MAKRSEQLEELKNMLIGRWVSNNISDDEWLRYKLKNKEIYDDRYNLDGWIWRKGMVILLTEEVMDLLVDKCEDEVGRVFNNLVKPSSSVSYREMQCSLVQLCTSVSDRMGQGKKCWSGHRLLCWVLGWMVLERIIWTYETIECVVNYLVKLLECDDMEMVKWAILTCEKWWVKMKVKLNSEQRDQLRTALTRHSKQTLEEALDLDLGNTERYQLKWCARWCEDNVVRAGLGEIHPIQLSRNRFEARCYEDFCRFMPHHLMVRSMIFSPVRSQFPVKSNVYFYEVICVTNEDIQVGWCTRETKFDIDFLSDAYNCKYSFLFKVDKKFYIQHNDQRHFISTSPSHNSVNVVGCLLDVVNQRFEFYLNGRTIECPTPTHFCPPYFATVGFSKHQHCNFNFGQSPFKYPPRNTRFTTFNEQSGGDARRYQLAETKFWRRDYWFKHSAVDNQMSLYFDDEIQEKFDIEVKRVEENVKINRDIGEWRLENVEMEEVWKGVRFIQAIIEVMGKFGGMDKVDVMAQFVGQVIANNIDHFLFQEKLLELLYPYLQLIPTKSTLTKHRSICIVLLHLIKCCRHDGYNFIQEIHSSIFTYLIRTLTSTSDQWTQLFVLIAHRDFEMSEEEKMAIEGCEKMRQMVETWRNQFEGKNVVQLLYSESEHRFLYQLFLCYSNLFTQPTHSITNPNATLNSLDLTSHLTLSPYRLSARSDWHWQSVRSVCQVSKRIFYFEVLLLTAGPMAIGWATRRTEIEKIGYLTKKLQSFMIGFDEFSISFDGYNRSIYHDDKTFQLENIPRWNAGDIVGCLIDKNRKSFNFYLNGSQINFTPQSPIYFSDQPYHALISLSQFQQVYLNFGQFPFSSYRPKYIDFKDFFYSSKPKVQEIQTKTVVNFKNANLKKNLISIDSNVKNGDVTITGSASTSKRSSESPVSIGNISSVQTLANVNIEQVNNSQIERLRMQCRICYSSPSTKLVRFVCCDTLPLCLDCLRTMAECPKCKKQTNEPKTETEIRPKPSYQCTLCTRQRASFRFISCDHFNLCQTCVNQILFRDCPRCHVTE